LLPSPRVHLRKALNSFRRHKNAATLPCEAGAYRAPAPAIDSAANRLSWSREGDQQRGWRSKLHRSKGLVSHFSRRRLVSDTSRPVRLCGSPSQLVSGTNQALYPQLIDRFKISSSARQGCPQHRPNRIRKLTQPLDAQGVVARCNGRRAVDNVRSMETVLLGGTFAENRQALCYAGVPRHGGLCTEHVDKSVGNRIRPAWRRLLVGVAREFGTRRVREPCFRERSSSNV